MPPEKKRFSVPWYVVLIIILGLILGAGAVFNQLALKNEAYDHAAPGSIPRNGGGVHIYTSGAKTGDNQPSVLLLGGWGTASPVLDYMPLIDKLSSSARVITVERPGYGYAADKYSERTLDNMVEEMRAGLDEIGEPAPYVIVAHTTAGLEAIHYAALYPEEVDGIVFINALSPGAYYYQPNRFLDYVKAFTYPIPKYTGIYRVIGLFKPEVFATGPDVDPQKYAAQYFKNAMSGAMRAELFMLGKNVKTALQDGDIGVPHVAFVDSKAYNDSNPELVRVWGEYFGNVIETDVGSYIHGFETSRVSSEVMTLVKDAESRPRVQADPEIEEEPEDAEEATDSTEDEELPNVYEDDFISFKYPADWVKNEELGALLGMTPDMILSANLYSEMAVNGGILVMVMPADLYDIEEIKNSMIEGFSEDEAYTFIGEYKTTIGNYEAVDLRTNSNGVTGDMYLVSGESAIYFIQIAVEENSYEGFADLHKKILDSIVFKPIDFESLLGNV